MATRTTGSAREVLEATSIFIGDGRYIGEVIAVRCGLFESAAADGRIIGTYSDARAALTAVLLSSPCRHEAV